MAHRTIPAVAGGCLRPHFFSFPVSPLLLRNLTVSYLCVCHLLPIVSRSFVAVTICCLSRETYFSYTCPYPSMQRKTSRSPWASWLTWFAKGLWPSCFFASDIFRASVVVVSDQEPAIPIESANFMVPQARYRRFEIRWPSYIRSRPLPGFSFNQEPTSSEKQIPASRTDIVADLADFLIVEYAIFQTIDHDFSTEIIPENQWPRRARSSGR